MADLSFEEDLLQAKANFDSNGTNQVFEPKKLTQKSKNIFSFLFLGSFLPSSWKTSWFWKRRSRRIEGKEPIEIEAFNTWKTTALEDDDTINESTAAVKDEEEDTDKLAFPFCCVLLLIPLIVGLLLLMCYFHPTVCHHPLQSLSQVPEATSHLMLAIANTTSHVMKSAGDNAPILATYIKHLALSCVDRVTGVFSYLIPNGSTVSTVYNDLLESLSGLFGSAFSGAGILFNGISSLFSRYLSIMWVSLQEALSSLSGIPSWVWSQLCWIGQASPFSTQTFDISTIPSKINQALTSIFTSTSELLTLFFHSFVDVASIAVSSIKTGIFGLGDYISSGASSSSTFLGNQSFGAFETIKAGLNSGISGLITSASDGLVYFGNRSKIIGMSVGDQIWTSMSSLAGGAISNTVEASKSGFDFISSFFSAIFAAFSNLDILHPIKWIWANTWTFLKDSSSSSFESVGQIGKDSAFYLASLPYTAVTAGASVGTQAVASLASGFSYFIFQSGYLLASAWERTNNYFRPIQQTSTQEATINYELLIEKVLNSDKFLNAVSQIANSKVDTESVKFKEQLATMMNAEKVAHDKQSMIVEQYKSTIDGIKVEVSNEIKKMTEEFVKHNLQTAEAKATEQDQIIMSLKEKYQQMLLDAELTRQGINTHTETIEKSNLEMQKQIEDLKMQINNLETEQNALNVTMAGCCKNASAIEITVEHYINDLLQNIIENKPAEEGKQAGNFAAWVNTYFVAKSEIETKLTALTADIDSKIQHHMETELRDVARSEAQQTAQQIMDTVSQNIRVEYAQRVKEAQENNTAVPVGGLSKDEVFEIVKNALIQYDADKTGMFDYALETAGGSVVSTRCTETYIQKTAMYSIFGIPIWYPSNNPRTIIQPGVQPGECWAFKGSSGFVVIKLSEKIVPTKFSFEHISKSMSPSGKIDSAPRDFVVYGLRHEKDTDPVKLGKYTYMQDQDPLQFFEVMFPTKEAFSYIELDVVSNHGNINYTCVYRFRVHGVLT